MKTSYQFDVRKMRAQMTGDEVSYAFKMQDGWLPMNEVLGKQMVLQFTGIIRCVSCGKITKKSFGQGFCYPCFMSSPLNAPCIIHPELCEAHLGKGRDAQWEEEHHNKTHYVYLANSGGIKVGVTREDQIPTRWIDQGADEAIIFARTPYRRLAGEMEVVLKNFISDKTNWRKMLQNIPDTTVDLIETKEALAEHLPPALQEFFIEDNAIRILKYPILQNPTKINSVSAEKKNIMEGKLMGIKAQYLLFEHGDVINIRNHEGYELVLTIISD